MANSTEKDEVIQNYILGVKMLEKLGIELQSMMELKQALFELTDGEETLSIDKARDVISLGFVGVLSQ